MKKKGFTLIELLAVIVVLAVIALIATPIVLNLVKTAKIGSAEQSVTGYVKAIENTIIKSMVDNKDVPDNTYNYDSIEVDVSGKIPTSGEYIVKNGKVESGNFCIDGYYIEYKSGQSKYNKDKECSNSNSSVSNGPTKVEPTSTDTHKGIVYLDPTNLENSCNASNSVSETGTKTGCMKWYIYSEDDNSYTMILDHNTTGSTSFYLKEMENISSLIEVENILSQLITDTVDWDYRLNMRLIEAQEISNITQNTLWINDAQFDASRFYLDSNNQTQVANSTNKSKYAWLYDYTNGCKEYGCNIGDSSVWGYWTNTISIMATPVAFIISNDGMLSASTGCNDDATECENFYGIRPVITISKSLIS